MADPPAIPPDDPVSGEGIDPGVGEGAVGALMAHHGLDAHHAVLLLDTIAEQQDRPVSDVARDIFAQPDKPPPNSAWLTQSYRDLGEAIGGLPGDLALRRVTELAVERVEGAAWSSLTLLHDNELTTVAATHPQAERADQLQLELGEGPCVAAVLKDRALLSANLTADDRWPTFARHAHRELGVSALLGLRLGLGVFDHTTAYLNIYSDSVRSFTHQAILAATFIAAHASTAVIASQNQHGADNLTKALDSKRTIGTAVGVLRQSRKVTESQAFALLRIASQRTNRPLGDIATDVTHTGTLPET